jgi:rhodanese-related sulfurtransferase
VNPVDISVADAIQAVADGAFLLDVREDFEWAAGHAADAVHVPMSTLAGRTSEIPTGRTIVCVCHVGARSAAVADALNRAGWTAVNMAGGMQAWEAAGLPVVTSQ